MFAFIRSSMTDSGITRHQENVKLLFYTFQAFLIFAQLMSTSFSNSPSGAGLQSTYK